MRAPQQRSKDVFDEYAAKYEAALNQGVGLSGEKKDFFIKKRINWLNTCLMRMRMQPLRVLDFGCGTGGGTSALCEIRGIQHVAGVDVSKKSIIEARRLYGGSGIQFKNVHDLKPSGDFDLVFTNGTFHHIPIDQREDAVMYIFKMLRDGGILSFWDNNPWNPGARLVMKRIPFDRDAIPISSREARALIRRHGFTLERLDYWFIFPRFLAALRPLEKVLNSVPIGAQYQVMARKGEK
jgi:SAM-dependent methyltransferase